MVTTEPGTGTPNPTVEVQCEESVFKRVQRLGLIIPWPRPDRRVTEFIQCGECEPVQHIKCGICLNNAWNDPRDVISLGCCSTSYCGICWCAPAVLLPQPSHIPHTAPSAPTSTSL